MKLPAATEHQTVRRCELHRTVRAYIVAYMMGGEPPTTPSVHQIRPAPHAMHSSTATHAGSSSVVTYRVAHDKMVYIPPPPDHTVRGVVSVSHIMLISHM
jgi:hypothetical protein